MLQIKTIYKQSPEDFDKKVNEALADGWALVRRAFDDQGFLAEMAKETITEAERTCENCRHVNTSPTKEPCFSCSETRSEWEEADI